MLTLIIHMSIYNFKLITKEHVFFTLIISISILFLLLYRCRSWIKTKSDLIKVYDNKENTGFKSSKKNKNDN